jgi:Ca2+-binding EF-hand superfamily protein
VNQLERYLNISREELVTYQEAFKEYLDSKSSDGKVGINKAEFKDLLGDLNEKMVDYFDRMFDTYDRDKSGLIDFREVVCFISLITKGSFQEKLKVCFDVFDLDRSGHLKDNELANFVNTLLAPIQEEMKRRGTEFFNKMALGFIKKKFQNLSDVNDGFVSFYDLKMAIMSD